MITTRFCLFNPDRFMTYGLLVLIVVSDKWLQIGGKWYYFYVDGKMARNTVIGDYKVDGDGVRQENSYRNN